MKVTFVLPYAGLQGGVRVVAIYAERLTARGHDVTIISDPQVFSLKQKLRALLSTGRLPTTEPSYFAGLDVDHRVLDVPRPVIDADVPDADVVIATYYTTAAGVLNLSPRKGAKAIFIQNYEVEEGKQNPQLDATWRMPMHKITISKWLVDLARDKFGDDAVSHVPNSVDLNQFNAPPRTKSATPTIGLLYNPYSLKGLDTSLTALKHVAASLGSVRLIAFGAREPTRRFPLPSYADFHFRPAQHAIKDLYAQCDVWMCGSNVEGFHLPPLEAMACRCPVVSTGVGGPLDIIEDGVNGYLVPVKDAHALAERVVHVLKLSDAEWARMSDAAYATATRYSWDQATDLFVQSLERAIERSSGGELAMGRTRNAYGRTALGDAHDERAAHRKLHRSLL